MLQPLIFKSLLTHSLHIGSISREPCDQKSSGVGLHVMPANLLLQHGFEGVNSQPCCQVLSGHSKCKQLLRERQTDRERQRKTQKETQRETDKQRQTDRDRQTDREREKQVTCLRETTDPILSFFVKIWLCGILKSFEKQGCWKLI